MELRQIEGSNSCFWSDAGLGQVSLPSAIRLGCGELLNSRQSEPSLTTQKAQHSVQGLLGRIRFLF